MKKAVVVMMMVAMIAGCGAKRPVVILEKGTPAHELGKSLMALFPYLDPDANTILASSDDFRISAGEVLDLLKSNFGNRTDEFAGMDKSRLSNIVISMVNRLADSKTLLAAAKKANLEAGEDEIAKRMESIYAQNGGEANFTDLVTQQGISLDFIKKDVANQVMIDRYLNHVVETEGGVSEEDIEKAYDEFLADTKASVRHILLLTQNKTDAEKKALYKKMQDILKLAKAGQDFAELAKKYSEDPGSRDNGGLYENFSKGVMVKPFEDAAFSVPVGEISDIIETTYGYHILKVVDRTKGSQEKKTLDEMRPELLSKLKQEQWQTIIPKHISELKEKTKVKIITLAVPS